jgi:hypothetical protein
MKILVGAASVICMISAQSAEVRRVMSLMIVVKTTENSADLRNSQICTTMPIVGRVSKNKRYEIRFFQIIR